MWDDRRTNEHHTHQQPGSRIVGLSALKLPARPHETSNRNGEPHETFGASAESKNLHHARTDRRKGGNWRGIEVLRAPVLDPETLSVIAPTRYSSKYVPVHWRTVNADESDARRIAWGLKAGVDSAIQVAAPAMAALIDGPCWLVPVPASDGSLSANVELARAIADLVPGARVKCALARSHPVDSSCDRRLNGHFGLTADQHAIIRTAGPMQPLPVYFVDNVITTGTTIAACRHALGWGTGLAFADGSTWKNSRPRW